MSSGSKLALAFITGGVLYLAATPAHPAPTLTRWKLQFPESSVLTLNALTGVATALGGKVEDAGNGLYFVNVPASVDMTRILPPTVKPTNIVVAGGAVHRPAKRPPPKKAPPRPRALTAAKPQSWLAQAQAKAKKAASQAKKPAKPPSLTSAPPSGGGGGGPSDSGGGGGGGPSDSGGGGGGGDSAPQSAPEEQDSPDDSSQEDSAPDPASDEPGQADDGDDTGEQVPVAGMLWNGRSLRA